MSDLYPTCCPICDGELIELIDEWICSNCGAQVPRWPRVGGKCSGVDSDAFLTRVNATPPPISTAPEKPIPPVSDHVPEAKEANTSPRLGRDPLSHGLPRLPAPVTLMTNHKLQRLMMGSCGVNEAPTPRPLPQGPTGAATLFSLPEQEGCFSEVQQKLCKFYDETTHICKVDGTAWCANPSAVICWTRVGNVCAQCQRHESCIQAGMPQEHKCGCHCFKPRQ